ncbi:MAG: MltA domain-containing protein, partial [Rhizobiaceae bacterium]|nr:MltA domain-containing protein [Rhizobiaceae bacterium]
MALAAFRRSAARHRAAPYKQRAIDFDSATFAQAAEAALALHSFVPADAKRFFESWFAPHRIDTGQGGHVTAYYEPVIEARRVAGPEFGVPFMARPDDLVELSDTEAAAFGPDGMRFARRDGERLCPYPDRAAIETGALAGRGLEIAFVADPVDAFFAHVQGCARLLLPEGEIR